MKKMFRILFVALVVIASACSAPAGDGPITVKVKKVEQVEKYTYLLVKGKGPAYWVALPSREIAAGSVISYRGGMLMENFESKDLGKTFDKIWFIEGLEGDASTGMDSGMGSGMMGAGTQGSKVSVERLDTDVEAAEGSISLKELFSDPEKYEGQTIVVSGEIAKYNPAIMERNWIHIQDGTEFEGQFDLTATSLESFAVGQKVNLKGTVALNQDFGYGYIYEVLLENATAVR